jgi:hypothetical protein
METAEIELQIASNCQGCQEIFNTELDAFNHKIRCDSYYNLDKTNKLLHDYCNEKSKRGKSVIVNKELQIDFNYVKSNIYRCKHVESDKFISSEIEMNPRLKNIYEDNITIILSDCIASNEINKVLEKN